MSCAVEFASGEAIIVSRIRTVKPEFFASEDVSVLPFRTRLTWIGLWTTCDDHGRCKDNVGLIKAAVWPLDDVSQAQIEDDLKTLCDAGRIVRYEHGGHRYLAVQNWHHHQRINRATRPQFPQPSVHIGVPNPGESGHCPTCFRDNSVRTHGAISEPSRRTHGGLTVGKEGKGKEGRQFSEGSLSPHGGLSEGSVKSTPPRCQKHKNLPPGEDPGPCGGCRTARLEAETAAIADSVARAGAAEKRRATIKACIHCDDEGWVIDTDGFVVEPAKRCTHSGGAQ